MVNIFLTALGFLLILLLVTEEFREALKNLWMHLMSRPWGKYLAYPLALVLGLVTTGLILYSLWSFVSTTFSYD